MLSATKPKSAIDDLFADADSDDDLDIFSSRNIIKKHAKEPTIGGNIRLPAKGFLNVMKTTGNIATSTPESNASGLFNDDENDDANLFGSPKKESHKAAPSSTNTIQESNKKVRLSILTRNLFKYFDTYIYIFEHKLFCNLICLI